MDAQGILAAETAHFSQTETDKLATVQREASALLARFPTATERALADKLATLCDCPRWVAVLVSKSALAAIPADLVA